VVIKCLSPNPQPSTLVLIGPMTGTAEIAANNVGTATKSYFSAKSAGKREPLTPQGRRCMPCHSVLHTSLEHRAANTAEDAGT
jgi:hypothetical protein